MKESRKIPKSNNNKSTKGTYNPTSKWLLTDTIVCTQLCRSRINPRTKSSNENKNIITIQYYRSLERSFVLPCELQLYWTEVQRSRRNEREGDKCAVLIVFTLLRAWGFFFLIHLIHEKCEPIKIREKKTYTSSHEHTSYALEKKLRNTHIQ